MGTLVPPNWSIQRFSAQHVTSGYAVEETAAAVLLVVIPVERGAGRQWNVASCVRLHVQAPLLQMRMSDINKRTGFRV